MRGRAAPWCGVCAASSPPLRWFDRWTGGEVQVVLVGLDWSSPQELADYRIRGYPTYYVLDADGRIAGRDFGYTTAPGLWLRTRGP
jgi:hypothetical protein